MAIINQRWPRELCPTSCVFGRSRNDVLQRSPRTRQTHVISQGRPLWAADCTWSLPNTEKLAKLRYWLESLEGFAGSVQVWNFASPFPQGVYASNSPSTPKKLVWLHLGQPYVFGAFNGPSHWQYDATAEMTAAASAGDTEIAIAGLQASSPAVLQGQYVQVGRRLYVAAAVSVADGSGEASITLASPLISDAADGEIVRLVEAACEMRLAEQSFDESASGGQGYVSVSARFIETVEDFS